MISKTILAIALFGSAALARPDGAHGGHGGGHDAGHGGGDAHGSSSQYGAPASGGYSAPDSGYGAPDSGYGAPSYGGGSGYGGGSSGYGGPSYYGGDYDDGFPLAAILIPLLILAGLALLFPAIVTIDGGRKKRDVAMSPMNEIAERVNDIYYSVVESEECMQRIACEVGGLAGDFGLKERTLTTLAEPFVPSQYKSYYKQFTAGKNCQKIKCGKLNL